MKKIAIVLVGIVCSLNTICCHAQHWQAMINAAPPVNTPWVGVDVNGMKLAIARVDMQQADPANYSKYNWIEIGKVRQDWKSACVFNRKVKPSEAFYGSYEVLMDAENSNWEWRDASMYKASDNIIVGVNQAYYKDDQIAIAKMTVNDLIRAVNNHDTKKRDLITNDNAIVIGAYDMNAGIAWFTYGGEAISTFYDAKGLKLLIKKPKIITRPGGPTRPHAPFN